MYILKKMTRKLNFGLIVIAFLTLGLISCEKDSDDKNQGEEEVTNLIIGTWVWTESYGEGGYESHTETYTFNDNDGEYSYVFIVDEEALPEGTTYEGENPKIDEFVFSYTKSEDQITFISNGNTVVSPYSIAGNNLTLSFDGNEKVFVKQ